MDCCFVCAKKNESVIKITDPPFDKKGDLQQFICQQCLRGGTYKQDYHLKPLLFGEKGFNLCKRNRVVKFYSSRTKAMKALYESFNEKT